jgi:hypothetical protein
MSSNYSDHVTFDELNTFQQVDQYDTRHDPLFQQGMEYIIASLMMKPVTGREFEVELYRAKAVYAARYGAISVDVARYVQYKSSSNLKEQHIASASHCPYLSAKYTSSPSHPSPITCPFLVSSFSNSQKSTSSSP